MPGPALFIGVVSHSRSRFAISQGPEGLAARLAAIRPGTEVRVNTADLLDESRLPITPDLMQASLSAELHLDREWAHYLGRPLGPRWWAGQALRWLRRAERWVRPPTASMLRRLLNIELSHLDLMRSGLATGAPWILILEDDAMASDITDLCAGLDGLMTGNESPAFINLSRSFETADLGIDHLLSVSSRRWAGAVPRSILAAERPVTNTVCAILYHRTFLAELIAVLDRLPMTPVLPIDWKLNVALMHMFEHGRLAAGACLLVDPAPIVQMSMQPAGILPS